MDPEQSSEITPVIALYVYPIKSCRGISLQSSAMMSEGLLYDRRFMFIDDKNNFLTIRQDSRMTLIRPQLTNPDHPETCELVVSIDGNSGDSFRVPAQPLATDLAAQGAAVETVTIWEKKQLAYVFPSSITSIISDFLEFPVRLAYCTPELAARAFKGTDATLNGISGTVGFADIYPLQIASISSLEDLNDHLTKREQSNITVERFRPNVVLEGLSPWDEDSWLVVSFISCTQDEGRLVVDILCRCARCLVPNVMPDTAVKDLHEPWSTLMQFRRIDEGIKYKPCFGMLGAPRLDITPFSGSDRNQYVGQLQVGDLMRVEERTQSHRYLTGFS